MSGTKLFVDTNIVLYLLSGDETIAELLNDKHIHISFITQLELLGYSKLTAKDKKSIEKFIESCTIIDINNQIKKEVIRFRNAFKSKLPDAIIAASSTVLNLPLLTADKEFSKFENELNLVLYELD